MMRRWICVFLLIFLIPTESFSFPFKCDKDQVMCVVDSKRLTVGDKVAILSEGKIVVAIGQVTEIQDQNRIVKITRKWGALLRDYEMEMISDEQFINPEAAFLINIPSSSRFGLLNIGLVNYELGEVLLGPIIQGSYFWSVNKRIFFSANIHYLHGSGEAFQVFQEVQSQGVVLNSYGATGGVSGRFFPLPMLSLRLDSELGFSRSSIKTDGGTGGNVLLDGRVEDGLGLYVRAAVSVAWHRQGFRPEIGFGYIHLQQSNNPSLFLGVASDI